MRLLRWKGWKTHLGWDSWGSEEVKGEGQESHLHLGWVTFVLSEHTKVTPAPCQTPPGLLARMGASCAVQRLVDVTGHGLGVAPQRQNGISMCPSPLPVSQCKPSPLAHCFHVFLITFQHGEGAKTINIRWEFHPPTPTLSCSSSSQNLLLYTDIC